MKTLMERLTADDLLQQDEEFVLIPLCREAAKRIEQLKNALSVALGMLAPYEPGDSRAVSDEFVALATVECEIDDEASWVVINAALERMKKELNHG